MRDLDGHRGLRINGPQKRMEEPGLEVELADEDQDTATQAAGGEREKEGTEDSGLGVFWAARTGTYLKRACQRSIGGVVTTAARSGRGLQDMKEEQGARSTLCRLAVLLFLPACTHETAAHSVWIAEKTGERNADWIDLPFSSFLSLNRGSISPSGLGGAFEGVYAVPSLEGSGYYHGVRAPDRGNTDSVVDDQLASYVPGHDDASAQCS
ncbi:predicted protein [Uncinocarpus reesii 1704]|uniref:Uncharacterized protein n=1 Tax=Uncinocarpus reesii (strain UAMH 1704) TaxID=336963 RepID=C4JHM4_UNCRE|nr:uncharacterized protein UREG_02710 [Uncinocarpus reesii 1704]EEP77861.1 predicted protein [Uncinocarpus reesii 1704]